MKTYARVEADPIPILYAHLMCVDAQLHDREMRFLNDILDCCGNESTRIEVEAVFSQKTDLIPIENLLSAIPVDDRSQVLDGLIRLSCKDGIKAPEELAMIKTIASRWGFSLVEIESRWEAEEEEIEGIEDNPTHLDESFLLVIGIDAVFGGGFLDRIAETGSSIWKACLARHRQGWLFAGPEYASAVNRCAEVAKRDFEFVEPMLNKCVQTLESLLSNLTLKVDEDKKDGYRKSEKQVADAIMSVRKNVSESMRPRLTSVRCALYAKHRAMRNLTVAFMGRTKSGKSTLHAVVTGGGWNAIGVGHQRTTRYNRVYEWRNIRIIDTPGIGAPEEGGRRDEEIASSIIDEADIICFVVTNDSQQQAEFAFLEKLKNKAKPLLILLNVKSNLDSQARIDRFLRNTDKFFQMKGENDLLGHVNRIRRYTTEFYGNDYFDVVPVHLHAARLSREARDGLASTGELWEASRIQTFLDMLQMSLVKEGPIRRSQTLIGTTVCDILEIADTLKEFLDSFTALRKELDHKSSIGLRDLQKAGTDAELKLENGIKSVFSALRTTVREFAEENWKCDEKSLKMRWENHVKSFNFEQKLTSVVRAAGTEFQRKVQDTLEEIGKELQILGRLGMSGVSLQDFGSSTSYKALLGISGSVLGLVGTVVLLSNPIGWAIIGLGAIAGFLGSILTSKAKKIQKKTDKICEQLSQNLQKQEKELIESQKQDLRKMTSEVDTTVSNYFKDLMSSIDSVGKHCESAMIAINDVTKRLNHAFASRVLNWMCEMDAENPSKILSVLRKPGRSLRIETDRKLRQVLDVEYIRRVLQEDVSLEP